MGSGRGCGPKTAGRSFPAAGLRDAGSSASATSAPCEPRGPRSFDIEQRSFRFPKQCRLLRSKDFRLVYDRGFRVSGPYFAALCLTRPEAQGPRIGFSASRKLGGAVQRNRIRRLMRESVRLEMGGLEPRWDVVFHLRTSAATASFDELRVEVRRVFQRCAAC